MILLTILTIMLLTLIATMVVAISIGGAAFIIVFGDVIVCVFLVAWIVKKLISKKNR